MGPTPFSKMTVSLKNHGPLFQFVINLSKEGFLASLRVRHSSKEHHPLKVTNIHALDSNLR